MSSSAIQHGDNGALRTATMGLTPRNKTVAVVFLSCIVVALLAIMMSQKSSSTMLAEQALRFRQEKDFEQLQMKMDHAREIGELKASLEKLAQAMATQAPINAPVVPTQPNTTNLTPVLGVASTAAGLITNMTQVLWGLVKWVSPIVANTTVKAANAMAAKASLLANATASTNYTAAYKVARDGAIYASGRTKRLFGWMAHKASDFFEGKLRNYTKVVGTWDEKITKANYTLVAEVLEDGLKRTVANMPKTTITIRITSLELWIIYSVMVFLAGVLWVRHPVGRGRSRHNGLFMAIELIFALIFGYVLVWLTNKAINAMPSLGRRVIDWAAEAVHVEGGAAE